MTKKTMNTEIATRVRAAITAIDAITFPERDMDGGHFDEGPTWDAVAHDHGFADWDALTDTEEFRVLNGE
jgi:hypothetical protein